MSECLFLASTKIPEKETFKKYSSIFPAMMEIILNKTLEFPDIKGLVEE